MGSITREKNQSNSLPYIKPSAMGFTEMGFTENELLFQ
jgi:hypothetical protein